MFEALGDGVPEDLVISVAPKLPTREEVKSSGKRQIKVSIDEL